MTNSGGHEVAGNLSAAASRSTRRPDPAEAQLLHVVQTHGQQESPQLREQIRAPLKDEPAGA
jgi:hypothetical protein